MKLYKFLNKSQISMAEIVRLSEWPFEEDEFVTLWWLRSPQHWQ